jgi:hypothetical protein
MTTYVKGEGGHNARLVVLEKRTVKELLPVLTLASM